MATMDIDSMVLTEEKLALVKKVRQGMRYLFPKRGPPDPQTHLKSVPAR